MLDKDVGRCMAGLTLLGQGKEDDALDTWGEDWEGSLVILGSIILGLLDARGMTIEDMAARAARIDWEN